MTISPAPAPAALLQSAINSLPTPTATLQTPLEAVALLFHALQIATKFDPALPLPASWNDAESFKFKYHSVTPQGDLKFELALVELGERVIVAAVGGWRNETATFSFTLNDYVTPSVFPFTLPPRTSTHAESDSTTESPTLLLSLFTSFEALQTLINLYRVNILARLLPDVISPEADPSGSSELASSLAAGLQQQRENERPRPAGGETGVPLGTNPLETRARAERGDLDLPSVPLPGIDRDAHGNQIFPQGTPQANPFSIGSSDLDPLGGATGTFPGFPGSRGPSIPGAPGGDGMFVGPDHPLFRERFPNGGVGGIGIGREGPPGMVWTGAGWLPAGAAPPGARFDPMGPFSPNGDLGGAAFPGRNPPAGRGNGGRRNFGDDFPPPGFNNSGSMFG